MARNDLNLRDSLELMKEYGIEIDELRVNGGGAICLTKPSSRHKKAQRSPSSARLFIQSER